jgi:hypothetical protein
MMMHSTGVRPTPETFEILSRAKGDGAMATLYGSSGPTKRDLRSDDDDSLSTSEGSDAVSGSESGTESDSDSDGSGSGSGSGSSDSDGDDGENSAFAHGKGALQADCTRGCCGCWGPSLSGRPGSVSVHPVAL